MSSVIPWFKRELGSLIKGSILFLLVSSGLWCAILLRLLEYNGTIIVIGGVLVEGTAMILCYFIFKGYLKIEEEVKLSKQKGKKT